MKLIVIALQIFFAAKESVAVNVAHRSKPQPSNSNLRAGGRRNVIAAIRMNGTGVGNLSGLRAVGHHDVGYSNLSAGGGVSSPYRNVVVAIRKTDGDFGNPKCPCIGFEGIDGETTAMVNGAKVSYPADLGASCKAWDQHHHPECEGTDPPGWCSQSWCYVDPRECEIAVLPKESSYQPDASFQMMPLYYSYSTCGAEDTWTEDVLQVGMEGCRCIGIEDSPGSTLASIDGKKVSYPAEIGGECAAWDEGRHPDCTGESPPDWCAKKWCLVDPCSCTAPVPPKVSMYFGNGTFQGRPIFWSYATCGADDTFSSTEQQEKSKTMIAETCSKDLHHEELGNKACPCIGFDNIEGETTVMVGKDGSNQEVAYPADLGATCQAWDSAHNPECTGETPAQWCEDKWCYVDPKNCDLDVLPKVSAYLPGATFQAMPVYYSYATCGAEDQWATAVPEVGMAGCHCVGFAGSPGTTMASIDGKEVAYPAEIGGECKAWDDGHHPGCMGENAPDWCAKKWCFVDPCSCTAPVPPKVSTYLGDATYQGKPVFWSYATCGAEDTYSSKEQQEKSKTLISETCKGGVSTHVHSGAYAPHSILVLLTTLCLMLK